MNDALELQHPLTDEQLQSVGRLAAAGKISEASFIELMARHMELTS